MSMTKEQMVEELLRVKNGEGTVGPDMNAMLTMAV
jgi:hypothetical protein